MFSEFFIKRPIFASVLSIVIVLVGLIAMLDSPVEKYPRVAPPQITVSAVYSGADAETIAKRVAAPLEEQINGAKNMIYLNSESSDNGTLGISVYFEVGTDPDDAKIDVNNRVQQALSRLPEEVRRVGVTVGERSPDILKFVVFHSPNNTLDSIYIHNFALVNVLNDIKRVKGVGDARIFGSRDYSIRVWIDPVKLQKYQLSTTEVIRAIEEQNAQYAAGKIANEPLEEKQMFTYTVKTPSQFETPEEFDNILIRSNPDGSALRLKDVAKVELGAEDYSVASKLNNSPAVGMGIYLQSGANALEVGEAVNKALEAASKRFPEDMTYTIPYDTTKEVSISIQEVVKTFIEAIVLVVLIIFLFLQNWRATLIPLLAVPVSIIGAFAGMYALGFSINLLTLFGLILAIGIVVDDAIIVIENVERHMSEGMNARDASFKAMKEVSGALVAIVLVLASVFVPVSFTGGLSGEMYRQFAITIIISVAISGFVALTLTPALCAIMLKDEHKKPGGFFKWFNNAFDKATSGYTYLVKKTIRYSFLSILLFGGLIFVSYDMMKDMKTSLVPQEDGGGFLFFTFNPPAASLSRSVKLSEEFNSQVFKNENVENVMNIIGVDFTSGDKPNAITSFVMLKDWSERTRPDQHESVVLADLMNKVMQTQDGFSFGVRFPPISGMSLSGGFEMFVQDRTGGSTEELARLVNEIIEKANKRPELMGVRGGLNINTPRYQITLDDVKAKAKGVNIADIYATLNTTLGSYYVNDFSILGKTYKVNMQAIDTYRDNPEDLEKIFVKSSSGEMLPLSAFITLTKTTGADFIQRFNLFQAVKVEGQPGFGYASGDALKAIEEVANEVLPEGYTIDWVGTSYQEKQISSSSTQAFVFGIIFLFLILAAQYERWTLPISIILAVPFAIFGAIVATNLRGLENDIYFQVGLLVLAGLSAKNAILIVEFALQKQKEGFGLVDAALEAAKIRLRPIIMTSLAFTVGVIPLAISSGAGAASRQSLGTGVIGGMIAATFLAIIFIPLFYILVSKLSKNKKDVTTQEK